ncbi:ABC transporter permease subunit, partial [Glaciimonas sp. GG7]
MTSPTNNAAPAAALLDRSDERYQVASGFGGAIRSFIDRIRSGDLGFLPVILGTAIIWTIFQCINPIFLSSNNLINMLFDASTVGVISLGIVCILMVGEIDLSVGSVSGFASSIVGVLWVNHGWPVAVAIAAAVATGALIGLLYAQMFNRFGMPSFVSTLAGLLAIDSCLSVVLGIELLSRR